MNDESNHASIFEEVIKIDPAVTSIRKLLTAKEHKCEVCGQTIRGDIPFKIHVGECRMQARVEKKETVKKTPSKPRPPAELARMLRGKFRE